MQSVTDAAATQEPPSCELIMSLLVILALCAHFKLHMFVPLPGVAGQGPKVSQYFQPLITCISDIPLKAMV